jgi:glycosyltransferase involved in cell wall biosynthesis
VKLSATIITYNEEHNIKACLESLFFVDEIVVVDSGSTDQTEAICRSFAQVCFYYQPWLGFGKQKNAAAAYATHDWILNIDADERVSDALRQSICFLSLSSEGPAAFRMARENYFGAVWVRHSGWYPDFNARLYDKGRCSFSERVVHESLVCPGELVTLAGNLIHKSYRDVADFIDRQQRYAALFAEEQALVRRPISYPVLVLKSAFTFIKMYLFRRGFLDGATGFLLAVLYSHYTFTKYARMNDRICSKAQRGGDNAG